MVEDNKEVVENIPQKKEGKRDEKGRLIVAENVHFIINASIRSDRDGK